MNRVRYGHWGRPVLVFPAERGKAEDFEHNGVVDALSGLLDAGRVKLYCVDSFDAESWSRQDLPVEERARRHGHYESWILGEVVPWIYQDCGGPIEVATLGCDTTGALRSTNEFAALLAGKGITHELDLWGHDVPHDWPSWRAQVAHHLPRFC